MQKKNIIIAAILVVLVGGGAFYGGTVYEKNSLNSQGLLRSANGGNRQFGQGQGGPSGSVRPGGAGANRNGDGGFTAGQVIAKDDKSITIKSNDGSSKIVFFSDSTTIGKATQGSAADLNNGEQVVVNGQANSDGTVTAQNIQIRPQGN